MNLQEYQDVLHALILGTASAEDTARVLFGEQDETTVIRLSGYREGYLGAQREGLEIQHPQTHAVVTARYGEQAWRDLVASFLDACPEQHPHRVVALEPFAGFVASRADLPPWLGELARLERDALLASVAPDEDTARIEPRTTVAALRWDVLGWNRDGAPDLFAEPELRETLVLTWRAPGGETLQAEVAELDALLVRCLLEGRMPGDRELSALGCGVEELLGSLEALREIGAVRDGLQEDGGAAG
jgi:hypothetical protein